MLLVFLLFFFFSVVDVVGGVCFIRLHFVSIVGLFGVIRVVGCVSVVVGLVV